MAWFRCSSGGSGTSEPTLLWTNSDPTSAFAAQTVSLDLSSYDYVIIYCKNYRTTTPSNATEGYNLLPIDSAKRWLSGGAYGGGNRTVRQATASTSDIKFEIGYSSATSNNDCCIPLNVWGVNMTLTT